MRQCFSRARWPTSQPIRSSGKGRREIAWGIRWGAPRRTRAYHQQPRSLVPLRVQSFANNRQKKSMSYHQRSSRLVLLSITLALAVPSASVNAQFVGKNPGPCPRGSAPVNGSCGSPSSPRNGALPAMWQSRFGALAFSPKGGVIGVASDQVSARAAKKIALRKCSQPDCRIVAAIHNGCATVACLPGAHDR